MVEGARDDHYKLLGLASSAGDADVKRAYKAAALRWHPDKNPQDRARAESMFKRVAEAYRTLNDPRQRASYDRTIAEASSASKVPTYTSKRSFVPTSSPPPAPTHTMEDAYSLFEDFFGGQDPFKDFDELFKDPTPSPGAWDQMFQRLRDTLGGGNRNGSTRSSGGGGGLDRVVTIEQRSGRIADEGHVAKVTETTRIGTVLGASAAACEQSGAAAASSLSKALRVRCLGRHGVAYRSSPHIGNRIENVRGPACGDIVIVLEWNRNAGWVRDGVGWLPLSMNSEVLFEFLDNSYVLTAQCISPHGVSLRRSMDMNDRVSGVRGPNCGEVVIVEERRGHWLRVSAGWLPVNIDSQQVFTYVDVKGQQRPCAPSVPEVAQQHTNRDGWSLATSLGLPVGLLSVLGATSWVALRTARFMFSSWWRVTFGLLPRIWR